MKYTAILFLATLAIAFSVKTNTQANMQLQSQMKKLQNTKWGRVASSFLELQMTVGSPVGDLVQAFQDFLRDNQFKVDINTQDYNWQKAQHDGWVKDFEDTIAFLIQEQAISTNSLDNHLYPLKASLEDQIARDNQLVADTLVAMDVATTERAASSGDNSVFVSDATDAIAAIDECLALLASLDSGSATLIQTTMLQKSFKRVGNTLKKTRFSTMIKALLKLADFANADVLARLVAKFEEVRASLVSDIAFTLQQEDDQAAAYATFMGISQTTVDDARQRVVENTAALHQCVQDIADTEAYRAQCAVDQADNEQQLADEHARWDKKKAEFDALFAQLADEAGAIDEVIQICVSIDISDETMARLDQ